MTIELTDIIRTTILIIVILAGWKIIKLAAKQWMHDRKLQYRRMKRRYGTQTHNILAKPKPMRPTKEEIWSGLLDEEVPAGWKPERHTYSQQEYTNARKGAQR